MKVKARGELVSRSEACVASILRCFCHDAIKKKGEINLRSSGPRSVGQGGDVRDIASVLGFLSAGMRDENGKATG